MDHGNDSTHGEKCVILSIGESEYSEKMRQLRYRCKEAVLSVVGARLYQKVFVRSFECRKSNI